MDPLVIDRRKGCLMRNSIVSLLFMLGLPIAAFAQVTPISMFNNVTGWAMASNSTFASNGLPLAYNPAYDAATSSAADYVLSEYGNGGMFGSLSHVTQGNSQTWTETSSPAGWLTTTVSFNSGSYGISIAENSVGLPCLRQNVPAEYDIFMGPNTYDMGTNVVSAISTAYRAHPEYAPSLSQLAYLTVSGEAVLNSVSQSVTPTACTSNHGGLIYGYTLVNRKINQTISYALTLAHVCLPGPTYSNCVFEEQNTATAWYQTSTTNAVTDNPTEFSSGIKLVPNGSSPTTVPLTSPGTITFNGLNLLPRLIALVQSNPYHLDNNISDWQIGAPTYGTNIWGDSSIVSSWYYMSVAAACKTPTCS